MIDHISHIHPDGSRFVMLGTRDGRETAELGVVVNWFEELRQLSAER